MHASSRTPSCIPTSHITMHTLCDVPCPCAHRPVHHMHLCTNLHGMLPMATASACACMSTQYILHAPWLTATTCAAAHQALIYITTPCIPLPYMTDTQHLHGIHMRCTHTPLHDPPASTMAERRPNPVCRLTW